MRICPKCGHAEPPIWRNTLRRIYVQHCHISDLELWDSSLAEELKEKGYVCKDGVKYRLNRSKTHVHRIDANLCKYPDENDPRIAEPDTEKSKARVLGKVPNQTLLELEAKP